MPPRALTLLALPLLLTACPGPTPLPPAPDTSTPPGSNQPFIPAAGAAVGSGNGTPLGTVYVTPNTQEIEFLNLLNEARTQGTVQGQSQRAGTCLETVQPGTLKPLTYNGPLAFASRKHSTYLASWGYEAHEETNASHPAFYGSNMASRQQRAYAELVPSVPWRGGSEIVTAGTERPTAAQAVVAFLHSPGHCRAITDPRMTGVGTGYVQGEWRKNGDLNVYPHNWTANFGF